MPSWLWIWQSGSSRKSIRRKTNKKLRKDVSARLRLRGAISEAASAEMDKYVAPAQSKAQPEEAALAHAALEADADADEAWSRVFRLARSVLCSDSRASGQAAGGRVSPSNDSTEGEIMKRAIKGIGIAAVAAAIGPPAAGNAHDGVILRTGPESIARKFDAYPRGAASFFKVIDGRKIKTLRVWGFIREFSENPDYQRTALSRDISSWPKSTVRHQSWFRPR